MTPKEVQEEDALHGLGQGVEDAQDLINYNKSKIEDNMNNTRKAIDLLKALPKKTKRKGESNFQHKIRQWTEEVKDDPKKFPGGQDQAIAIAAEQSGVSKANDILASLTKGDSALKEEFRQPIKEVETAKDKIVVEDPEKVDKAMTTRSFPVFAADITRSAITGMTRSASVLKSPEGIAPLVGDTFRDVEERNLKLGPTYKSCATHKIAIRNGSECYPCKIMKSSLCKRCGTDMHKSPGGGLMCKTCG